MICISNPKNEMNTCVVHNNNEDNKRYFIIRSKNMSNKLPTHAQVVIIGGGIVGCSTAYHLVEQGWKDVVLLERKRISSGTSWAAAGLLGQLWSTSPLTKLAQYGADLYAGLEAKTGQPTGYVRNGSIRVSRTQARRAEYQRALGMARAFGIRMEEIRPVPGSSPMMG